MFIEVKMTNDGPCELEVTDGIGRIEIKQDNGITPLVNNGKIKIYKIIVCESIGASLGQ